MAQTVKNTIETFIDAYINLLTVHDNNQKKYVNKLRDAEANLRKQFLSTIKALQTEQDYPNLLIVTRIMNNSKLNCPVWTPDIDSDQTLTEVMKQKLYDIEVEYVKQMYQIASRLYDKSISPNNIISSFRTTWLKKAISILIEFFDDVKNNEDKKLNIKWKYEKRELNNYIYDSSLLIAKSYTSIGLSILPKGKKKAIPEKKLEAMLKAEEWFDYAIQENKTDSEPYYGKVRVLYELHKMDSRYYNQLEDASNNLLELLSSNSERSVSLKNLFILDICLDCATDPNKQEYDVYNQHILEQKESNYGDDKFLICFPLLKVKAGLRQYDQDKTDSLKFSIISNFNKVIKKMDGYGLFSPVWNDVTKALIAIKNNQFNEWKGFAISLWEICHTKEKQMAFGLQIRQYWARLDDLYDMALKAALEQSNLYDKSKKNNNPIQVVKIIDSLKSRPTLTWNEMDLMFQNHQGTEQIQEYRDNYYKIEAQAAMGIYVDNFPEIKENIKILKKISPSTKENFIETVPPDWTVLHFYIGNNTTSESRGIAIAGYNKDNQVQWELFDFDVTAILEKYLKWRNQYNKEESGEKLFSNEEFISLVETIGNNMPFLFDLKTKGIIFIPHKFIHLLPLHSAINPNFNSESDDKKPKYLFQAKSCTYLPAWSFAEHIEKNRKTSVQNSYGFRYCNKYEKETFYNEIIKFDFLNNTDKDDADIETLKKYSQTFKNTPPKYLCLLCHGEADDIQPLNARLKLGEQGIKFLDLQLLDLNLSGSTLLLGPCDTELTPLSEYELDEHLSLASIFLQKGAVQIVGSMWENPTNLASEVFEDALNCEKDNKTSYLWEIVRNNQSKWMSGTKPKYLEDFIEYVEETQLFLISHFKVIGCPPISN